MQLMFARQGPGSVDDFTKRAYLEQVEEFRRAALLWAGHLEKHLKLVTALNKKRGAAKGREAMNKVEQLGGSAEVNDEIFNLAADIFGSLTKEANGDPQKVKKILEEAQRNPEEFAKKLSASEKKKLHSISQKMPSN